MCKWLIEWDDDEELELDLEVVNMDFSIACNNNKIELYKDVQRSRKFLSICSRGRQYYRLVSNVLMVVFSTDGYTDKIPDFILSIRRIQNDQHVISNCGDISTHNKPSYITTINHPNEYFPNWRCDWKVINPRNQWIILTFLIFDMEQKNKEEVCMDALTIYEGTDDYDKVIGKFCGRDLDGRRVYSDFQTVILMFNSDSMENNVGFVMHLDFQDTIDPSETDYVFDRKTFYDEKRKFRGMFRHIFSTHGIFIFRDIFENAFCSMVHES